MRRPARFPKGVGNASAAAAGAVYDVAGFWNFVFLALVASFIIFVTARGRLGKYLQLFLYVPPAASTAPKSIPGEHKAGTVNSDAAPGQQYSGQAPGGDVNAGPMEFGPLLQPLLGKIF